jgi:hypothetical protein
MLALMWGLNSVCVWPVVEPEGWKLDPATNMFKVGHQACVLHVQRNKVYSLAHGRELPTSRYFRTTGNCMCRWMHASNPWEAMNYNSVMENAQVEERTVEDADRADLQHLERLSRYMVHLETGA